MKIIKYILVAITAIAAAACNDTVYVGPDTLPVKSVHVPAVNSGIMARSDGAVTFEEWQYSDHYELSYIIIDRFGNKKVGEQITAPFGSDCDWILYRINSSDELFVDALWFDLATYKYKFCLVKFNADGTHAFTRTYENLPSPAASTPLEDGGFAIVCNEYFEGNDAFNNVLYFIDSNGELKDYVVVLEDNFFCYRAMSFGDRIVLTVDDSYSIYRTDGTLVNSGKLPHSISALKYVAGNLYAISVHSEVADGTSYITQMDIDGNLKFTVQSVIANISENILVQDGSLIVLGMDEKNGNAGLIQLIDTATHEISDTIKLNYQGLDAPNVILPDGKGGYDLFIIKKNSNDQWAQFKSDDDDNPLPVSVYIYHTNDLHNLQID